MNDRTDPTGDLWAFALKVYGSPDVSASCLELQDSFGADVPVLLTALWLARRGVVLDAAGMEMVEDRIGPWRDEMVQPLRALRRRLKAGPAPAPSEETEALRTEIKRAELHAEKIELATLATSAAEAFVAAAAADFRQNLAKAMAHYAEGAEVPERLLSPLVAAAEAV